MNIEPQGIDDDEIKLELDREMAEVSSDDLDRLIADKPQQSKPDERGRLQGRIIEIRGPDVYVDIGGKSEAFLSLDEFDPHQPPEPGQTQSFVMQGFDSDSGLMRLSLREAKIDAHLETLKTGDIIEARVTGLNVGGLELTMGDVRAFLPKSQVELHRIEDFTPYIGRRLECEITEIDRKKRNLVLSRRNILKRQREEMREQTMYALSEGQIRQGVVRRLTDFGAFVDLGGVDGLLHVSDMSYTRVTKPSDMFREGDEVEVKVLKIDLVKDRISLGTKQLTPDPWNVVAANYRPGETVNGRVTKLLDFGAFIELEPGVEGLLPISELSWTQRVRHPRDVLTEGDAVRVSVLTIDLESRKLSLSLRALSEDPWQGVPERYAADAVVKGRVARLADFGAFVQLEEGVEGLVHISEMSDKRIRAPGDVVKVGDVVDVRIKAIDVEQRRISLSLKSAAAPSGDSAAPAAAAAPSEPRKRKRKLKGGLDR